MARYFFILLTTVIFLSGSLIYAQDNESFLPAERDMYTVKIIAELSESRKNLEQMLTFYEREDQKVFKEYNEELIKITRDHISIMEKLIKAIRKGKQEDIPTLERQKDYIAHTKNVAELKREMAVTMADYERRAQSFPDDFRVKTGMINLKNAFRELIDAQVMLYQAETQIKEVYGKRDKAIDLLEMYILDAGSPARE